MKRKFRSIVIALVIATSMLFESCADVIDAQYESNINSSTAIQEETTDQNTTKTEETKASEETTETSTVSYVVTEVISEITSVTEVTTTTTETTTEVSETTTSKITTTHTTKTTVAVEERALKELPASLQWCIDKYKSTYPKMKIGFGVFSLDGTKGYTYNIDQKINGACSLKAPYELWVLLECQKNKTDIWKETIKYEDRFYDTGSGSIKKSVDYYYKTHNRNTHKFTQSYSIGYLLNLLTTVSDNIAYKMLLTRYPIKDYQVYLNEIGGQQFSPGQTYGQASVRQRLNEWTEILKYINSKQQYSEMLKENLHNTQFCSLVNGMKNKHDYLHKSGWNEGHSYNSACDIAVIDNQYLIIIMTQDDTADQTRNIVVKGMGLAVESYVDAIGGYKNLFKDF